MNKEKIHKLRRKLGWVVFLGGMVANVIISWGFLFMKPVFHLLFSIATGVFSVKLLAISLVKCFLDMQVAKSHQVFSLVDECDDIIIMRQNKPNKNYKSKNHSNFILTYHIIFTCKYRKKLLVKYGDWRSQQSNIKILYQKSRLMPYNIFDITFQISTNFIQDF